MWKEKLQSWQEVYTSHGYKYLKRCGLKRGGVGGGYAGTCWRENPIQIQRKTIIYKLGPRKIFHKTSGMAGHKATSFPQSNFWPTAFYAAGLYQKG